MLTELRVENLLLIEGAELRLAPGLNVITGETGAGKTVLAHALDLLLGGRPRSGIVRPGAAEAYVEGSFELTDEIREHAGELLAADAREIVLARRVGADGRTRAYVNGRSANVGDLRDLGERLLAFYGQHEHRRLMLASTQLALLDGACGRDHGAAVEAMRLAHARVLEIEREAEQLRELAGARDRELDLLEFELGEIEAAELSEDEKAQLLTRRDRLRHVEALAGAAAGAAGALDDEEHGCAGSLAAGRAALEAVAGIDGALDPLAERWRGLAYELDDLARELREYTGALDADLDSPAQLQAVEERLSIIERLERKHGGSLAAVLAHGAACAARRDELAAAEVSLEHALDQLAAMRAERDRVARELSAARRVAAPGLEEAVRAALGELAMEGADFAIAIEPRAVGPTGADAVEFLIAANAGVAAAPLREVASGGELSRVMLALMSSAEAGGDATLVFDEVDAGIGGHAARAVGARLKALATRRQLLCITHLPQIASLADRHFAIEKDATAAPARTTVRTLAKTDVVGELVRMLGADEADAAARRHARELLKAA